MNGNRAALIIGFVLILSFGTYGQTGISLDTRLVLPPNQKVDLSLSRLGFPSPRSISFSELSRKSEEIIAVLENMGYPFASVNLDSVELVSDELKGLMVINTGPLVLFDSVMNKTDYRISPAVFSRLLDIKSGDTYKESVLKRASGRLDQVPGINQSRPMAVGFHSRGASVYVYPAKATSNRFDGWIGLSPDSRSAGSMGISGSVQLALDNVLRQCENWSLDWRRNQDASQKIRLSGHFPYLAGLPVGFSGKFELIRQDTSYVNVDWELGLPYHFSPSNHLSLFLRKRESTVLASGKGSEPGIRQPYSTLLTGLSWNLNRIDNTINPYRGFILDVEALTGKKQTLNYATYQQTDLQANITYFQPLLKNLTLEMAVSSGIHISDLMLENEGYRLGGVSRLRGFDEDQFMTDAFLMGTLELRYLLDKGSHLVILADQAILKIVEGNPGASIHPTGFGLGGQIKTAGGVFRLIFAIGKLSNQPVILRNGKIHLGYIAVF